MSINNYCLEIRGCFQIRQCEQRGGLGYDLIICEAGGCQQMAGEGTPGEGWISMKAHLAGIWGGGERKVRKEGRLGPDQRAGNIQPQSLIDSGRVGRK